MNAPDPRDPAALLHRALRDLPDQPAPRSLEERVLVEIAARAARPWWRQPVTAWPMAARAALITACLASAAGLTQLVTWGVRDGAAAEGAETLLASVGERWAALETAGHALARAAALVPSTWLLGLAAVGALGAAALGGGIAAYRSLCVRN